MSKRSLHVGFPVVLRWLCGESSFDYLTGWTVEYRVCTFELNAETSKKAELSSFSFYRYYMELIKEMNDFDFGKLSFAETSLGLFQIKSGDIRVLTNISLLLVKKECSSEIRLHAFKMLQHLVRLRWEELSPSERRNFAKLSIDLMSEIASPCEEWSLKSQSAALVAEIVRREGTDLWQELFPSLASLSAQRPLQDTY